MAKLINNKGVEIPLGSEVVTGSGESMTLLSFTPPHKPGSTGRVYLKDTEGHEHSFFPTVIGAKIVDSPKRPRYGMVITVAHALSSLVNARIQNEKLWGKTKEAHECIDKISQICSDHMPRGSGIDQGTKFLLDPSTPDKLVFQVSYHHMDEHGFYDGWSDFTLFAKASFTEPAGTLFLKGRDRNDIKDYLYDIYHDALGQTIAWDWEKNRYAVPTPETMEDTVDVN
jgi:hypothetical protein